MREAYLAVSGQQRSSFSLRHDSLALNQDLWRVSGDAKANLSAKEEEKEESSRLPCAHEHARWKECYQEEETKR